MGELAIRRNRGFAVPRYQGAAKGEKTQGSTSAKAAARTTVTVSETLRQLMSRVSQAEGHIRESRRTLQTGEGALAEVQDSLERMSQLAKQSAQGDAPDRAALQQEMEELAMDIDRMIRGAVTGETPLFLDGDSGLEEGAEALLQAVLGEEQKALQHLPDWLARGLAEQKLTPETLLAALGLDKNATGPELLAAVTSLSLESSSAADRLAALYLGAVIAGDEGSALEGLEQLMEKLSQGVPLDEAIAELTDGEFAGLADFQAQFSDGTAPGLEDFLVNLFLSDSPALDFGVSPLLSLLEGMEGANLDLMMGLLTVLQNAETAQPQPDQRQSGAPAAEEQPGQPSVSVRTMGGVQVMGKDLSGVTYDEAAKVLTVSGDQSVTIFGTGQEVQSLVITGSGRVTVQNVTVSGLTVTAPQAQIFTVGENLVQELTLAEGTALTLDGRGLLRLGQARGNETNLLRLAGGAVIVEGEKEEAPGPLTVPFQIEGPVSLYARPEGVPQAAGKEPFDILWDALLPGWRQLTAVEAEGRQAKMALMNGEPARLWLSKGEHGAPIHTLIFRGRDRQGRAMTRYAYLIWNQSAGQLRTLDMYPNPFSVTGGEAGEDWIYEEETHTLRILSSQVTAVAGGAGTDANQVPFSGRIALADEIGGIALTLGGVACRVSAGRAFDLGRNNQVTLMLQSGTRNFFEGGAGCAGISLGEGTSLYLDSTRPRKGSGEEAGALIASGSSGGAGIGRDSGGGRDRTSRIEIRGGLITAAGAGGGAGIGAGKGSAIGAIVILGGRVVSSGETGGAGIGGGLGAGVGEISVRGGVIEATAASHAAAIGAGVQGECGSILITGGAKIVKAVGGDPGADIGACLFGGCGDVQLSGEADIGGAHLQTRTGVPLDLGEETVTLPQFRLSARALGLDQLSLSTPAEAQSAAATLDADRRWVSQIQAVYKAMYGRLGGRAVRGVQQYIDAAEAPVRDTSAADALLEEMRQSISLQPGLFIETHNQRAKIDAKRLLR